MWTKNRLQLVLTGFCQFFNISSDPETGNRKFSRLVQPQPMVRLHSVASGLVSVIFSVHATGLSNTIHDALSHLCCPGCSVGVQVGFLASARSQMSPMSGHFPHLPPE